jgi:beta-phosphoglucomutase-like phosphatase (HAD superfamily)
MEPSAREQAFLFDLDGTLVDSVYQHVLAWQDALERAASSCRCGGCTAR